MRRKRLSYTQMNLVVSRSFMWKESKEMQRCEYGKHYQIYSQICLLETQMWLIYIQLFDDACFTGRPSLQILILKKWRQTWFTMLRKYSIKKWLSWLPKNETDRHDALLNVHSTNSLKPLTDISDSLSFKHLQLQRLLAVSINIILTYNRSILM